MMNPGGRYYLGFVEIKISLEEAKNNIIKFYVLFVYCLYLVYRLTLWHIFKHFKRVNLKTHIHTDVQI